jgi:hypothetical protein
MQQALEILARQSELAALAQASTDDVVEARFLVHQVMSRAFAAGRPPGQDIPEALRRDMRALIRGASGRGPAPSAA